MSTPEAPTLSAPSNSPPIASGAEAILATAVALEAGEAAPETTTGSAEPEAPTQDAVPEKRTRSLSWNDAIKQVPPDIATLMKNMQGDYTRKTQELAAQKKDFLREREALMKGAETLTERELPEYDPFNEESISARIENEVNRRLKEVLEPMQHEYKTMAAEDNYRSFLTKHPEFESDTALRSEVQHLLEANGSLDLETAYWAAKGKQKQVEAEAQRTERAAKRKAQREAAMTGTGKSRKVSTGAVPDRQKLKSMGAADILALAQAMHRNQ
ncbi:MAG: hypothetical protein K0U52_11965 [Gammaproteobacteria bacterium]|nr:hypothetical protein [Gammaproteobacteria bacterium]